MSGVQRLLRMTGRSYEVDPNLPLRLVIAQVFRTLVGLSRGLLFHRTLVVIGGGTRIRGGSRVKLGRFATIGRGCTIDGYSRGAVSIGARSKIGDYSRVTVTSRMSLMGVGLRMGEDSALGDYAHVGCSGGVSIGNNVIGGPYVSFHSQNHVFSATDVPIRDQGTVEDPISIGDDCWIGAKATFLAGAVVGSGCVVAAGAVVRGSFPDNSVIAGVPAKIVASR